MLTTIADRATVVALAQSFRLVRHPFAAARTRRAALLPQRETLERHGGDSASVAAVVAAGGTGR